MGPSAYGTESEVPSSSLRWRREAVAVGVAAGREMMDGLRGLSGRRGLGGTAGTSGREWLRSAWEEWADGRDRDSFFMFFLEDLSEVGT